MTKSIMTKVTNYEACAISFLTRHPHAPDNHRLVKKLVKGLESKVLPEEIYCLRGTVEVQIKARRILAKYIQGQFSLAKPPAKVVKTASKMRVHRANL